MKKARVLARTTTAGLVLAGSWALTAGHAAGAPAADAPPPPVTPPPTENAAVDEVPAPEAPPLDPLARMADLEAQLEQMRGVIAGRQPRVTVGGYIDFGFFIPQGDGSGIIRDQANVSFPQYAGRYGWVFLG